VGKAPSTPTPAPAASGTPALNDIARFLAGTPTVVVEPAAWTVAGTDTNFVATGAGERQKAGTLLGRSVVVHFTPVSYTWVYGDGTSRTTSVPGATWQTSGSTPFTATPTSHVFANRGSYAVTVTVRFAARYQFAGQGWADIAGTLPLTSTPVTVTVKAVKTVLVAHDCTQDPSGVGCSP